MIPELGQFALTLALGLALVQAVLGIVGGNRGNAAWMAATRPAAQGQFVFVIIAWSCLTYAFVTNDFSVAYVAANSNTALPLRYRIAAVWGGHEGSILLWILMLTVWTTAVSVFSRRLPEDMVARVLGVMGLISTGFLTYMLFTSNPFGRLLPAAVNGRDLNPLLQDPGMVFHPPMLYLGYVGFSVAFAFAIAALMSGRLDAAWARWSRPWTTVAWLCLTLGIALGSAWSFYVLGWGGWWFWDPVENASFMPWLAGTALVHSLAVTEKRGAFKSWTVLLAILAFALSLLGTFLVRSGVLTSVHAFATSPQRGIYILILLTVAIGSSLTLFAVRAHRIGLGGAFSVVSREAALLANNVLLVVACATVLLGTLYPLALDALGLGKISVGPPYFNTVFVPVMAPAIFLMGIGPLMRWKKMPLPDLVTRLRWAAGVSVVTALLLPFAMGRWSFMVSLGLLMAVWIAATTVVTLWHRWRQASGQTFLARVRASSRSYYGMIIAHLGVAVFIVGVTLVLGYGVERDVRMTQGDTTQLAGYTFRFDRASHVQGSTYTATRVKMTVTRNGKLVRTLYPEKRLYTVQDTPVTDAAIDTRLTGDLYIALGDQLTPTSWIVRVQYKPFVVWIWGGCAIMALGGLLAASDRRYRVTVRATQGKPVAAARPPRVKPTPAV